MLPVVPHGSKQLTIQNSIKYFPIWPAFKILKLFRNMRVNENKIEFSNVLLQIGNNENSLINPDTDEYSIEIQPFLFPQG